MIDRLKKVHSRLYLPVVPDNVAPETLPFTVTAIEEPYLYTDSDISVEQFNGLEGRAEISVFNAGGGTLEVRRVSIPRPFGPWVKRAGRSVAVTLTRASDPLAIEVVVRGKELPDPMGVNTAELCVISDAKSKTFSGVRLKVQRPEDSGVQVPVSVLNGGEISAWQVSLYTDEAAPKRSDFFLIGDFRSYPPTRFEIMQKNANLFDVTLDSQLGALNYKLDLQRPGVVKPGRLKGIPSISLGLRRTVSVVNGAPDALEGTVMSGAEWIGVPPQMSVPPYDTVDVPVSIDVEKLEPGRNFGTLTVADEKVSVWVWYTVVDKIDVVHGPDQPNLHYKKAFSVADQLPEVSTSMDGTDWCFPIFEDRDFLFPFATGDQGGYLLGDFNKWEPRTLLLEKCEHGDGPGFGITLSVPGGSALFRADIDGEMRLSPDCLGEILWGAHGLASRLRSGNRARRLTLRNTSTHRLEVRLRATMEWLRVEPATVALPANGERDVSMVLCPGALALGLNLGWLEIETQGEPKQGCRQVVYVTGTTRGAVPRPRCRVLEFPKTEVDIGREAQLRLDIYGTGELRGTLEPSSVLEFVGGELHVQNQLEHKGLKQALRVRLLPRANVYHKKYRAFLATDCYLANLRRIPLEARYDLPYLIADPAILCFPRVFLFDEPQRAGITGHRSDGTAVECTADIPDKLNGFLRVLDSKGKKSPDRCEFEFNPHAVPPEGQHVIHLTDEKSDMELPVRFLTNVISGCSEIEIESPAIAAAAVDGVLLRIKNVGKTELRIFKVWCEAEKFSVSYPGPQRVLSSGAEQKVFLKLQRSRMPFFKRVVTATVKVKLNDPRFPGGIFEQEIEVKV